MNYMVFARPQWPRAVSDSKLDGSILDSMAWCILNLPRVKQPHAGVAWKFWKGATGSGFVLVVRPWFRIKSCGGIGTALHYATECIYTVSWHMRKPAPNFEQEWLKRVTNNLVSRQKIRGIIKFISENRDLFRPP
ncbi:hypothetical protein AVEN_93321-1 [Araneus ventricosus]|uniref:Uncharacterized protein n=1 Tax=Araneus ventricosus TaxID=182803 RepID=A0A4Y2SEM5_ARAVE|nr:hypothetical protein AVEN_93321-1 [Araneus ventricosus]